MADADPQIWDRLELLGKQMHICAIHHKNLWFSIDKPAQYATKLKVEDGSDVSLKGGFHRYAHAPRFFVQNKSYGMKRNWRLSSFVIIH